MYNDHNSATSDTTFALSCHLTDAASGTISEVAIDGHCVNGALVRKSQVSAVRDSYCSAETGVLRNPLETSSLKDDVSQPSPVRAPRLAHMRTRSATTSTASPSFIYEGSHRARAASLSGHTSGIKASCTYSMTLPRGIFPRVKPVLSVATEIEETIGSFSPTSCPREQLQSILETFAPPPRRRSNLRVVTRFGKPSKPQSHEQSPSSSPSPPLSPIPSICRTPSSYSESEYFPTAPSSAGPATPVHSVVSSPLIQNKTMRPILQALEDASKFRVQTACASCGKFGSNYPCCPRCGEMWCSRACRLQSTNGKRHVCRRKGT